MRLLHLADREAWLEATTTGLYVGSTIGADLARIGFVHACAAEQFAGVVDRFYGGVDLDSQVVLVVDVPACFAAGSAVRWDAPPAQTETFPHIYGPIPVAAVVGVLDVGRDTEGTLRSLDLTGLDVISGPAL